MLETGDIKQAALFGVTLGIVIAVPFALLAAIAVAAMAVSKAVLYGG